MADPSKETIRNGVVLPFFTGKTLFSKSAHNIIVKALNALLNSQVERTGVGGVNEHLISDQNSKIKVSNDAGSGSTSSGRYHFKSMGGDYLVCRTWDGSVEGSVDINIAKPPKLRHSIASEVLRGVTVNYSSYSTGNQSRHATDGTSPEDQYITPPYIVNDEIYSFPCLTSVTVSGQILAEMDRNVDAREWAEA